MLKNEKIHQICFLQHSMNRDFRFAVSLPSLIEFRVIQRIIFGVF